MKKKNILVTGASGYLGAHTLRAFAAQDRDVGKLIAFDVAPPEPRDRLPSVEYVCGDVRSADLTALLRRHAIDAVVHLASILAPDPDGEELAYQVDVVGTERLVRACLDAGTGHIVVTTSGASYGYHPDNPAWLRESDELRGNDEFGYSRNKRLVEGILASYRDRHPELAQLIFRPGTILGPGARTPVTTLFDKPALLGVWGHESPFVFILDRDVAQCIVLGVLEEKRGIYNLAGDGALTQRQIARRLRKPYVPIPAALLRLGLRAARLAGLTRHGPETLAFLQYRPVLANAKLKSEFGYVPRTSMEAFERFAGAAERSPRGPR